MATIPPLAAETVYGGTVVRLMPHADSTVCQLNQGAPVIVSSSVGRYLSAGDEITVPLGGAEAAGTELYVRKAAGSRTLREFYQVGVGYVTQPKEDKRKELFVMAEVQGGRLGINAVHIPCSAVRDYFYVANRQRESCRQPTFYEVLRMPLGAGPGELRLSFRIRRIELEKQKAPKSAHTALERAYNILAQPEFRACYDALLQDPDAPALFPYGGFGSLFLSGERSRDGQTFFATRILAFRPQMRQRRFRAPLRRFEFHSKAAIYRDTGRKLEVLVDHAAMPMVWDQTWNQWKHLLGAKVEIDATFVRAGKYRVKSGEWDLIQWETALPSRLEVKLPNNLQEQVESARRNYHHFGQYSQAIDRIRARIQREPIEKKELEHLVGELGVPADFDVSKLTWRPDYDPFFYQQLAKRARRLYLFREEYIFDVGGVVAETPQLGHATYLFGKPASMEAFLILYTRTSKGDIRANRNNVAERLGFLGRIVHGVNRPAWLKDLLSKLGDPADCGAAAIQH